MMINKDTIDYKIVSLIGMVGEMHTEDLYRLKYGQEYIRKAISRLISNRLIKVYKFEDIKCLRLTTKCKKYLKENFPERFLNSFTGATSTNKIRNDQYRRVRYHRLGKVLVLLYLADIKIFADEKFLLKNTLGFTCTDTTGFADYCADKNTAEFYSSSELKKAGLFMDARTSRALGIIYSYPDIYVIYNVADGDFKWENKTEESFFYRAKHTFLWPMTKNHSIYPKLIFVGNNMETMKYILSNKNKGMKKIFDVRSDYDKIFFLDSSKFASQQLKYFVNGKLQADTNENIINSFSAYYRHWRYYDQSEDGTLVVNCTICNLAAVKRIKEELKDGKFVKVICFLFQYQYLQDYFGDVDNVEYYEIDSTDLLGT